MPERSIAEPRSAPPPCPRLLVSVRDAAEAQTAAECSVDLIDVKEPANGPLGAPAPAVVASVADVVGSAQPISIALGELIELPPRLDHAPPHLASVEFAKIGLAGAGGVRRWWVDWEQAWSSFPAHLSRVGVIYVDWQAARAPDPRTALRVFLDGGCRAVLFDTFQKGGRSLLDHGSGDLAEWIDAARTAAPLLVLAGSLSTSRLELLRPYAPEYVAIRGAACEGGRLGRISAERVRSFAAALKGAFDPAALPSHL